MSSSKVNAIQLKGRQINFPRIGTHDLFMRTEYKKGNKLTFGEFSVWFVDKGLEMMSEDQE